MTLLIALLATSIWFAPQAYIDQSDLIAVVNIGTVHEIKTPELIVVRSAEATVEKVIYYRWSKEKQEVYKLPNKIILYQIDPNGQYTTDDGYGHPTITEGRRFVILKGRGEYKFVPFDMLSLQEITKEGIIWPTTHGKMERFTLEQITEKINKLINK